MLLLKQNRERILKSVRGKKQIAYQNKPIKITADFCMETFKARRVRSSRHRMKITSTLGYSNQQTIIQNRWSKKSVPR
jgi:hypothetical protein